MNTIQIMPTVKYSNQVSVNTKNVNFKGKLGDSLLKEVSTTGKVPEVSTVISKVKGAFGFSLDSRLRDVFESMLDALKRLIADNSLKNTEIFNLQNQLANLKKEKDSLKLSLKDKEDALTSLAKDLRSKNLELEQRNEVIQKHVQIFKVKSLEELDIPSPEKVLSTIRDLDKNFEESYKSLGNYLTNGVGQEAFLKQLERINLMQKAKADGMLNITSIDEELKLPHKSGNLQLNAYDYALDNLRKLLVLESVGENLASKTMREQIKINAEALINPLKSAVRYYNPNTVESVLNEAQGIRARLNITCDDLVNSGFKKTGKIIESGDLKKSYVIFKDEKRNEFYDYSIQDLIAGLKGCYRLRNYDGEILKNYSTSLN